MPGLKLSGKVIRVGEVEQVTDSFKKRELVIETAENPQYPQFHSIEFGQDKSSLIVDLNEGDEVEVDVNLNGRKWTDREGNDKYFNSIQGWKVKTIAKGQGSVSVPNYAPPVDLSAAPSEDDLPF